MPPRIALLAAVLLCMLASPALADDWTVGEIAGPAGTTRIQPTAVNANDVVVGIARFPGRTVDTAFRWEDGTMIELQLPAGATHSYAYDVNDHGVIVGTVYRPESHSGSGSNGVTWTATRTSSTAALTAHNLNGNGWDGSDQELGSNAHGINEAGQIVGGAGVTWEDDTWGTTRLKVPVRGNGGGWSRLPMPDTDSTTYGGYAWQINEDGVILEQAGPGGDRAKLSVGGGLPGAPIEIIPGDQGLNDLGHVVGRIPNASASQPFHARLWNGSGYEEIGSGQSQSEAFAVNNSDWVVGRAGTSYATGVLLAGNGWLWRPDEAPTRLSTLAPTGWAMFAGTDINDDGMIVGPGQHGGVAVGFWMAPASIAHKLSGKVYGPGGAPVAGATVRILNGAGQEAAAPVTGADGAYEATLNRGPYSITVQPDGAYRPDGLAGCEIEGSTCRLDLGRNRSVDFYAIDIQVPGPPGDPPGGDDEGPTVEFAGANKTYTASKSGAVSFSVGPFAEAVKGSIALQTAKKVQAAKAKILKLGSKSFSAAAGKKVAVKVKLSRKAKAFLKKTGKVKAKGTLTVRDAAGNATVKGFKLTIKAAKRKR